MLSSNLLDEDQSIQVIVDEIWYIYDTDHSGALDKNEMKVFIREYMPEMKLDFDFD